MAEGLEYYTKLTDALSYKAVSVISGLALAVEVVFLGEEEAVGVLVAERLLPVLDVTSVGAVLDARDHPDNFIMSLMCCNQ